MSVQKEDVYETDDIPLPEEMEGEEQFEDQAVEKIHVDVEGAIKLFGNRLLNADAVDFSDALTNHRKRRGYRSGHYVLEMLGVENEDKETTEQKFRRLRCEVEELMETVSREKENEQWTSSISKSELDDLNDLLKAAALKKESDNGEGSIPAKSDEAKGTEAAGKPATKSQDLWDITKPFLGKPAPHFEVDAVVGKHFNRLALTDFRGKYVVLLFYPRDFTFVCTTEILSFSDHHEDFVRLNTVLLAVSTDSKHCHLEWANKPRRTGGLGEVKIPLLTDTNHKMSIDYGVLDEDDNIANRGLFIIDPQGVLRLITISDLPVGRSVQETLRLVQAFQFVEKHGEVCQTSWMPRSDTINLKESLA